MAQVAQSSGSRAFGIQVFSLVCMGSYISAVYKET